jgi:hypothetical protein
MSTNERTGRKRLTPAEAHRIRVNLVRTAGLAALLGLLMEALLVLGGDTSATLSSLLDNGLWPFLVCMAVAIGQAVSGGWPTRAGGFALIATPLAFLAAKVFQKAISVLLEGTAPGSLLTGTLIEEAALRAVEYAVLAASLAWLVRQSWAGALAHLSLGALVGLIFGLVIAYFLTPDSLVGWIVEELVFPTGCALIVFASETLTRLLPDDTPAASPS